MIFFLDTEFNGYKGKLMSLALVPLKGAPFYEVIEMKDKLDPWVKEHVVLGKPAISFQAFQEKLEHYLSQYDAITIVADWHEDIAHFCDCMTTGPGERLQFEPPTFIIRRDLESVKSKVPHHALEDAKAMMESYHGA